MRKIKQNLVAFVLASSLLWIAGNVIGVKPSIQNFTNTTIAHLNEFFLEPALALQIKTNQTAAVMNIFLHNLSNWTQGVTGATNASVAVYYKNNGKGSLPMTGCNLVETDATHMPGLYNLTPTANVTNITGELVVYANNSTVFGMRTYDLVDNLTSDTTVTGVKVVTLGIVSPQAFNMTGNITGGISNVTQVLANGILSPQVFNRTGNTTGFISNVTNILASSIASPQAFNLTGNLTGSVSNVTGNIAGSVASVVGNVGGNVTGNVTGNVSGNVIGNIGGNVNGTVASVVGNVSGVTGNCSGVTGNVSGVTGNVSGVTGNVSAVTNGLGSTVTLAGTQAFNNTGNLLGNVTNVTNNVSVTNSDVLTSSRSNVSLSNLASAADVRAEMDANSTKLTDIKNQTDKIKFDTSNNTVASLNQTTIT
jgi:hypothetical protein